MTDRPFVDAIAQAIGDPGSIVGMKGPDESVPRWSTRAVLQVLDQHALRGILVLPFDLDDLTKAPQ